MKRPVIHAGIRRRCCLSSNSCPPRSSISTPRHHTSYDIVPIIKATEKSGFREIYSIEFWTEKAPPPDPVIAAKNMIEVLAANIAPAK